MKRTMRIGWALLLGIRCLGAADGFALEPVRLDQCQVIGTHNSYHVAPGPVMDALIRSSDAAAADSLMYTHRTLTEQLNVLGVRQLELDLYADPEGGRYAEPRGAGWAQERGFGVVANHDPEGSMRTPGLKILHVPDVDYVTRAKTFRQALAEIRDWSVAHPFHFPVFVLVELKEETPGNGFTKVLPFDDRQLSAVDEEIREIMPSARRFEPDQLRGGRPTLREAVAGKGWPDVATLLGKVLFGLDNEGELRDRYLGAATNLAGRAMFVSVPREHAAAAWMKVNDPVNRFEEIRDLVGQGFLVRTRADAGTQQARRNDATQRERALASGAQMVSTDYPEPNLSLSPYRVQLPGGVVARGNPVSGGTVPVKADVEKTAADTASIQNRQGELAHAERSLNAASRHYARALELDPATEVSSADAERIRRLAPELRLLRNEPFRLRDVAAVIHPDKPWIGYHLFWEDDLDFPDDNDPCDHEVIWVEYDPATDQAVAVQSYFHGTILARRLMGERPRVAVEWGKHGSLPLDAQGRLGDVPMALKDHWTRLNASGRRLPAHPLGRGWPMKFEDDWQDYCRFDVSLSVAERLGEVHRMVRSRWPNAVLNQWLLPYNFAAKTPWPDAPRP